MLQAVRKKIIPSDMRRQRSFIRAWIRSPFKMGAVLPSSRWLADAMAEQVDMQKPGCVIELGAGTGAVTHALLRRGIEPERLLVVERDQTLYAMLSAQFHHLNVLCADASHLGEVLQTVPVKQVNGIVSSLPLLSMPRSVRRAIVRQMAQAIGSDGCIIQFTYGPKSPIGRETLRRNRLKGKRVKMVLANVPPAHVWVYHRI